MKRLKYIFTIFLLLASFGSKAQEELKPLKYNTVLFDQFSTLQSQQLAADRENVRVGSFVYKIDTMPIPFIDDFSTNRIKQYTAQEGDINIVLDVKTTFSANGLTPEELELVFYQTFDYTKFTNGNTDSVPTDQINIIYYDTNGIPFAYDTAFTNRISTFNQGTGLVTYDTMLAETLLINSFDTLFVVLDDQSLWMTPTHSPGDRGAFVNNNYHLNALTQGVATFDGTDATGFPYDATSETTYGIADMLESKPLYVDSNMFNVYLSFFYQAGGIGNMPDADDSLVLEFYNVKEDIWEHQWGVDGLSEFDSVFSDQVILPIDGGKFLRPGFKFRFSNYSTLSGSYDHWHIDYVRLDQDIDTTSLDSIFDISYLYGPQSYLAEYTSVPYSHYLADPEPFQADANSVQIKNIGTEDLFVGGINCSLKDESGAELLAFNTIETQFPSETTIQYNLGIPTTQIFTDNGEEYATFGTTCLYSLTGNNDLFINDTIRSTQVFSDYYSYDDGTAENGYALTGAGVAMAYQFTIPIKDTLKALYINLPQMQHDDNEDLTFKFMIWTDLNNDPIYEDQSLRTPTYTKGNAFIRYELDEELSIQGTFYIGFIQTEAKKIYIGYDKNTDSSNKLAYRVNGEWLPSKFSGSLLFRPDFGTEDVLATREILAQPKDITIYPNPTNFQFQFRDFQEEAEMEIYTVDGKLAKRQTIEPNESINVASLSEGLYFVIVKGLTSGQTYSARVVITK
jgi:hypothetical protein